MSSSVFSLSQHGANAGFLYQNETGLNEGVALRIGHTLQIDECCDGAIPIFQPHDTRNVYTRYMFNHSVFALHSEANMMDSSRITGTRMPKHKLLIDSFSCIERAAEYLSFFVAFTPFVFYLARFASFPPINRYHILLIFLFTKAEGLNLTGWSYNGSFPNKINYAQVAYWNDTIYIIGIPFYICIHCIISEMQ